MDNRILVGSTASGPLYLLSTMANRHGLIAGATGTGKTVTLRTLAEGFSELGVPVFMADVKGDLGGISAPGVSEGKFAERLQRLGITDWEGTKYPVTFWDVFGESGHPVRATVSELGPFLFSRLLNLNDIQAGVLSLVFKVADDNGMLLLDLKDLQAMLSFVGENAKELTLKYGNVSSASIGAIQRGLLGLQESGGERFFGEPALNIEDLLQTDSSGRGVINILAAEKLMQSPKIYSTFLLWLLSELFERLPEAGDIDKPKLVFFFDEAHLLFDEAPKALLEKIEQVVRLIRSKGVGVYFVSQSPLDIPDGVLAQLGNRVQHALRAFTAKDQKAVRATADSFRSDGKVKLEEAIGELQIGEALVSLLDGGGAPAIAARAMIAPPRSRLGPITLEERKRVIGASLVAGVYEELVDRESAYEMLKNRREAPESTKPEVREESRAPQNSGGRQRQSPVEAFFMSAVRSIGSRMGREIMRGIFGSMSGGSRKKRW
ncbi:MAG: putative ATPase [Pseudomonadota bacterium]|jgi:DNA helicase HerA-like ATPase